ncbi:uncharacterized protein LOC130933656 [Arachis stenosperma]|uniref:uncharacterized protein LOC130933656 n=1 Tax=Arachis stenosperma TaxID=217475 RepID=UPI0025AD1EF5|nr:uncharacterized protein LOC130933656 [Arachis stenosperma]
MTDIFNFIASGRITTIPHHQPLPPPCTVTATTTNHGISTPTTPTLTATPTLYPHSHPHNSRHCHPTTPQPQSATTSISTTLPQASTPTYTYTSPIITTTKQSVGSENALHVSEGGGKPVQPEQSRGVQPEQVGGAEVAIDVSEGVANIGREAVQPEQSGSGENSIISLASSSLQLFNLNNLAVVKIRLSRLPRVLYSEIAGGSENTIHVSEVGGKPVQLEQSRGVQPEQVGGAEVAIDVSEGDANIGREAVQPEQSGELPLSPHHQPLPPSRTLTATTTSHGISTPTTPNPTATPTLYPYSHPHHYAAPIRHHPHLYYTTTSIHPTYTYTSPIITITKQSGGSEIAGGSENVIHVSEGGGEPVQPEQSRGVQPEQAGGAEVVIDVSEGDANIGREAVQPEQSGSELPPSPTTNPYRHPAPSPPPPQITASPPPPLPLPPPHPPFTPTATLTTHGTATPPHRSSSGGEHVQLEQSRGVQPEQVGGAEVAIDVSEGDANNCREAVQSEQSGGGENPILSLAPTSLQTDIFNFIARGRISTIPPPPTLPPPRTLTATTTSHGISTPTTPTPTATPTLYPYSHPHHSAAPVRHPHHSAAPVRHHPISTTLPQASTLTYTYTSPIITITKQSGGSKIAGGSENAIHVSEGGGEHVQPEQSRGDANIGREAAQPEQSGGGENLIISLAPTSLQKFFVKLPPSLHHQPSPPPRTLTATTTSHGISTPTTPTPTATPTLYPHSHPRNSRHRHPYHSATSVRHHPISNTLPQASTPTYIYTSPIITTTKQSGGSKIIGGSESAIHVSEGGGEPVQPEQSRGVQPEQAGGAEVAIDMSEGDANIGCEAVHPEQSGCGENSIISLVPTSLQNYHHPPTTNSHRHPASSPPPPQATTSPLPSLPPPTRHPPFTPITTPKTHGTATPTTLQPQSAIIPISTTLPQASTPTYTYTSPIITTTKQSGGSEIAGGSKNTIHVSEGGGEHVQPEQAGGAEVAIDVSEGDANIGREPVQPEQYGGGKNLIISLAPTSL